MIACSKDSNNSREANIDRATETKLSTLLEELNPYCKVEALNSDLDDLEKLLAILAMGELN